MVLFKQVKNEYLNESAITNVIKYIFRLSQNGLVGGNGVYPVSSDSTIMGFSSISKYYKCTGGDKIKHFVISDNCCKSPLYLYEQANRILNFFKSNYQAVFAIHDDTDNLHIHFVVNNVNLSNGTVFSFDEILCFRDYVNGITN